MAAFNLVRKSYQGNLDDIVKGGFQDARRIAFADLSRELEDRFHPSLLMGFVSELDSLNLIHKAGIPGNREENYANYPIEVTIMGIRFIVFVLDPEHRAEQGLDHRLVHRC